MWGNFLECFLCDAGVAVAIGIVCAIFTDRVVGYFLGLGMFFSFFAEGGGEIIARFWESDFLLLIAACPFLRRVSMDVT